MDEAIRTILSEMESWAVVGCSPDPARTSHGIAAMLQRRAYRIVPVNPHAETVLGERCYDAAKRARTAGLLVVMDRCPAIELGRLGLRGPRRSSALPVSEVAGTGSGADIGQATERS